MQSHVRLAVMASVIVVWIAAADAGAQEARRAILPEQRCMEIRDPARLCRARIPNVPTPPTVSAAQPGAVPWPMSLDEAIRVALENAAVVRIVAGNTAVASGATIYDPAITNTTIDQSRARFDPTLQSTNTFSRTNQPFGAGVPPGPYSIQSTPQDGFRSSTGVSKTLITGGAVGVDVNANRGFAENTILPLNPETSSNVALRVDQPLLQGAGSPANLAPILIARINTEKSFFQMKDSVQDLVLSVIQTYWSLSYAQTELWARQQQVKQGLETLERAEGRLQAGLGNEGDVAQARVSYQNFVAAQIAAEANLLNQEAVLRNLLGLPPADQWRITPATSPSTAQLPTQWNGLLELAEQYRPDIIEMKLILEADQQQLLLSRNQALPQLNVGALYRWNGLEGTTPDGQRLATRPGDYGDWEAGVTFSVPLGLRKERAVIRERELLLTRDRVNLEQAMHSASHLLATSYRNLSQYYAQYQAYEKTRKAAELNIEQQMADYLAGRRTLYLNVLLAINDWGNAVMSEHQALTQYNTELARMERLTGTILETHGVRFCEERYRSIGPLGRLFADRCYPLDMYPGPNADSLPTPPEQQYRRPEEVQIPGEESDPGNPPAREVIPAPEAMMPPLPPPR